MQKRSSLKIWIAASALAAVVLLLGAFSYRDALALTDKLVVLQAKTLARTFRGPPSEFKTLIDDNNDIVRGVAIYRKQKRMRTFGQVSDQAPPKMNQAIRENGIARVTLAPKRRRARVEHKRRLVIEFVPTWAQRSEAHARRDVFSSGVVALFALLAGAFLSQQQKRAQLAESKAKAAEHLAHLGEMSAVLAHEIKNPLASLKGHAQLLEEKLEGKPKDKAGLVIDEAKRLQILIGDLLDFARTKDIERREVAVKTLVERTLRDFGELEFNVDLSKAPDFFALEQGSFERVLSNLVDNARTWGENQNIDVTLVKEKDELVLSVRDRGPGVSDDIKEKIFAPFFTQKTRGGAGLGLSIVSRIAQTHGGSVAVENAKDKGARFIVRFGPSPKGLKHG